MNIMTIEVAGIGSALHAMRNPMNSWNFGDSRPGHVGMKDRELSNKLVTAGDEHGKHIRMCMVWADMTFPLYWWKQFDTYRIGIEKVSTSTMHKLMARPLEAEDFQIDVPDENFHKVIMDLNWRMEMYKLTADPEEKRRIWRYIVQMLPECYLQKRTVMMSYAALRNIYRQRKGHKLMEWEYFLAWIESLPESWMITGLQEGADEGSGSL